MNTILFILLIVGLFGVYVWHTRKAIQDADALAWATASEPFEVISRHHADTSVTTEAEYIRKQLKAHGNKYLNPDIDVWEYVYSASHLTTSRDFQVWKDMVLLDVLKRREAWRKQKMEWNEKAAKEKFAGQTIYTVDYANGRPQNTTQQ